MEILLFGAGCPKCKKMSEVVDRVIREEAYDVTVKKIQDLKEMMSYGVMSVPALMIDGTLLVSGRVPSAPEVRRILAKACGRQME